MDYLADATFLIDLWREQRGAGAAVAFATAHSDASFGLPWIVKGEFLRGAVHSGHDDAAVSRFLGHFLTVLPTEETIRRYASLFAALKRRNQMIGANDLWIAAAALELELPLLTRNAAEFHRVPGLKLVPYTAPETPQ